MKEAEEVNLFEDDLNVTPVCCISVRFSLKKSQLCLRRIEASHVVSHYVVHETLTATRNCELTLSFHRIWSSHPLTGECSKMPENSWASDN